MYTHTHKGVNDSTLPFLTRTHTSHTRILVKINCEKGFFLSLGFLSVSYALIHLLTHFNTCFNEICVYTYFTRRYY